MYMRSIINNLISKYLLIFCMVLMVICSIGCHGQAKNALLSIPDEFDTSRNYEISFWAKNDDNLLQQQIYEETIKRFEEYYPNIKVNIIQYSKYPDIYNDVIKNISTKTTPNVCITYPDYVATYIQGNNVVVPLDNFINNNKYGLGGSEIKYDTISKEDIYEKFLDEGIVEEKQYVIPFMRSSEATYVNKDYVERLGYTLPEVLTWDFIWEVSKKAKEERQNEKKFNPFIYKSTDNMMIQMTKQLGYGFTTDDGGIELFNDDVANLLMEISEYAAIDCFETFTRVSYPGNFFNRGNCVFAIDSTAGATWMGSNAPLMDIPEGEVEQFETVVLPVPQYDTENPQMISQGPSICIFNKDDNQEVLASWLFAQFLLNDQTQIDYAKTEGYIPVTKTAVNSTEYQYYLNNPSNESVEFYKTKIDASKVVLNNIDNTFITPVFYGSSLVRQAGGNLIELAAKCKVKATREEIDEMYKKTQEKYSFLTQTDDLGPYPQTAKILLASLVIVWIAIGGTYLYSYLKNKKLKNKNINR